MKALIPYSLQTFCIGHMRGFSTLVMFDWWNLSVFVPWKFDSSGILSLWLHLEKIYGNPCVDLEKAMAPHSSTLAWKIPWTEEPGWLQFMGSQRVGHDWATSLSMLTKLSILFCIWVLGTRRTVLVEDTCKYWDLMNNLCYHWL